MVHLMADMQANGQHNAVLQRAVSGRKHMQWLGLEFAIFAENPRRDRARVPLRLIAYSRFDECKAWNCGADALTTPAPTPPAAELSAPAARAPAAAPMRIVYHKRPPAPRAPAEAPAPAPMHASAAGSAGKLLVFAVVLGLAAQGGERFF